MGGEGRERAALLITTNLEMNITDSSCGLIVLNVFPEVESTKFPLIKA